MLSVQHLTLKAGQRVLVHDVSLTVHAGESLALMGASGSGKSLTAMALAQLLPPNVHMQEGKIQGSKARPALIMQNPADCFDPLFRMRAVFYESFSKDIPLKERASFVQDLLQRVGFAAPESILEKYPFELSGGMLHRCMIALALGAVLLGKASCIIADEPLCGLDTPSRKHILQLIQQLQAEYGFALLYIDHDLASASQLAQNLAIMHEGQVVEQGPFAQVVQNPQHATTVAMVQAYTRLKDMSAIRDCGNMPPTQAQKSFTKEEATSKELLVSANHISKSYAGIKVLQDVSLQLYAGQSVGLVGANGAGKSTMMRILLGLEAADHGEVFCLGHRVQKTQHKAVWRPHMQAVFQHARLAVNPRMQAQDILLEPIRANRMITGIQGPKAEAAKVAELLELVKLPTMFAKKYPSHMSGGQLQRLCLARALALQPKVLLLDESLADLDAVVSEHLQTILQELKEKLSLSFLYISHDIPSVLRLCDQVAVLEHGRVVESFMSKNYATASRHAAFLSLFRAVS